MGWRKTMIPCGGCAGCGSDVCTPPSAPASTLVRRLRSASKSKCGFLGYAPGSTKYYQTYTPAGSSEWLTYNSNTCSACIARNNLAFGGVSTIDRSTCLSDLAATVHTWHDPSGCVAFLNDDGVASCADAMGVGRCTEAMETITVDSDSQRRRSFDNTICHDDGLTTYFKCAASGLQENLGSEYTTAILKSDVDAALPAFSGGFGAASPFAIYDLSVDEVTISEQEAEYKFTLPDLSGYACYKLTWIERFTAASGGGTVDTYRSYLWDGFSTETGVYTLSVPSSPGSTTIINVSASCACS